MIGLLLNGLAFAGESQGGADVPVEENIGTSVIFCPKSIFGADNQKSYIRILTWSESFRRILSLKADNSLNKRVLMNTFLN